MHRRSNRAPPPLPPLRLPSLSPPLPSASPRPPSVSPLPPESPPAPPMRPQQPPPISVVPIPPTQSPPQPPSPATLTGHHISIPKELIGLKITSTSLISKQKAPSPRASKGKDLIRQQNSSKPLTLAALYGFSPLPDVTPPIPESPVAEIPAPAADLGPMSFSDIHFTAPTTATPIPEPPAADISTPAADLGPMSFSDIHFTAPTTATPIPEPPVAEVSTPAADLGPMSFSDIHFTAPTTATPIPEPPAPVVSTPAADLGPMSFSDIHFTAPATATPIQEPPIVEFSTPAADLGPMSFSDIHFTAPTTATPIPELPVAEISTPNLAVGSSSLQTLAHLGNTDSDLVNGALSQTTVLPADRLWADRVANHLSYLPNASMMLHRIGVEIMRPNGVSKGTKLKKILSDDMRFTLKNVDSYNILVSLKASLLSSSSSSPRLSKDRTGTSGTQHTPSATNNGSSDKTASSSSIKASSSGSNSNTSSGAIKEPIAAPTATSYLAFFSEAAFEPLLRQWQDAAAQYLSTLPQQAALTSVVGESIRRPSGIPASVKLRRVLEADERFSLREVAGETVLLVELVKPPELLGDPTTDTVEPQAEPGVTQPVRAKSPPPPSPLSPHHPSLPIEEGQVEDEDATPERQPSPAPVFPLPPPLPEHMLNAHRQLQPSKSSLSTSINQDTDNNNYDTNTTNINTNKNVHITQRHDEYDNPKRQKLINKLVKFTLTAPSPVPVVKPVPSLPTSSASSSSATPTTSASPFTSPRSSYITPLTRTAPSGH